MKKMLIAFTCVTLALLPIQVRAAATNEVNLADFYQLYTKRFVQYVADNNLDYSLFVGNSIYADAVFSENFTVTFDSETLKVKEVDFTYYDFRKNDNNKLLEDMFKATAVIAALEYPAESDAIFELQSKISGGPSTAIDAAVPLLTDSIAEYTAEDFAAMKASSETRIHTYSGNYEYSLHYQRYEKDGAVALNRINIIAESRNSE